MFFTSSALVAHAPLPATLKRFVRNQSGSVTSEFVVVSALIISLAAGVLEMTSNGTQVLAEKVGEEVLTERDPSGGRDRHRPAQGGYSPVDDGAHKSTSGARETASTGTTSGNGSTASGGSKDNTSKKTRDDKTATPDKAAEAPSDTAKEPATKPVQKDKKPEKTAGSKKAQKKKSGSDDSAEAGEPGDEVVAENEYDPSCYKKNGKLRKRCR